MDFCSLYIIIQCVVYVGRLEAYDRNQNFNKLVDVPVATDIDWPVSSLHFTSLQQHHHSLVAGVCLTKIQAEPTSVTDKHVTRQLNRTSRLLARADVPIRIQFESDVPIRKFRIGRTCRVPSYHKLRSLTKQR